MDDTSTYPKLVIIDETQNAGTAGGKVGDIEPLPEEFGRNLDTLERARQWLSNPHNWHTSKLYILRWNGLLCTVQDERAKRMIAEPWDDGLPWAAVYGQREIRSGRASGSLSGSQGGTEPGSQEDGQL